MNADEGTVSVIDVASLRRIRALHPRLAHVLVGDGWSVFRHGGLLLDELLAREGG